ncbi:hypothetical protein [Streptomyces sp. 6N106]|uniref:hypothetical protein n=1 Tax=Streptomyces sp. 6N106 TaxID=3457418 RepID=UPI003FCFBEA8
MIAFLLVSGEYEQYIHGLFRSREAAESEEARLIASGNKYTDVLVLAAKDSDTEVAEYGYLTTNLAKRNGVAGRQWDGRYPDQAEEPGWVRSTVTEPHPGVVCVHTEGDATLVPEAHIAALERARADLSS